MIVIVIAIIIVIIIIMFHSYTIQNLGVVSEQNLGCYKDLSTALIQIRPYVN